jgi:hypothetical protein
MWGTANNVRRKTTFTNPKHRDLGPFRNPDHRKHLKHQIRPAILPEIVLGLGTSFLPLKSSLWVEFETIGWHADYA